MKGYVVKGMEVSKGHVMSRQYAYTKGNEITVIGNERIDERGKKDLGDNGPDSVRNEEGGEGGDETVRIHEYTISQIRG
jgi:hypothetical protein